MKIGSRRFADLDLTGQGGSRIQIGANRLVIGGRLVGRNVLGVGDSVARYPGARERYGLWRSLD